MSICNLSLSVVIYKTKSEILENLFESLKESLDYLSTSQHISFKLYIINNDIKHNLYDDFHRLFSKYNFIGAEYIQAKKNGGYGYGHNLAIKRAKSDYHIVCNPDIEFYENSLAVAYDYMQKHQNIGLLTPAIFNHDGSQALLCKRKPKLFHQFGRRFLPSYLQKTIFKKYLDRFIYLDVGYNNQIHQVAYCSGCLMFFRASVLQKINGFDENFFMYMEDADISWRALQVGDNVYLPKFKVVHLWQRDSYNNKKLRNEAIKSGFKYWEKWGGIF